MARHAVEFDGCEIVEALESGPISDLYKAVQQPLGRPVLIKALSPSILPSSPFAATLEREARLLAELDHSNVLSIHDYVQKGERMWLVLEYVDGATLETLLEKGQRFDPIAACAIALEITRALEHSHARGIVHREIKPRNIWVARSGTVKLANFSVATDERMPTAPELLDGRASLDVSYVSPEQILGEPPDPRSDLFSLGMVLYRMLAGQLPFCDDNSKSFTQRLRHEAPPALGRFVPRLPSGLERLTHHCLQKLPSDRFSSAEELGLALRSVLRDAKVSNARATIAQLMTGCSDTFDTEEPPPPSVVQSGPKAHPTRPAVVGILVGTLLLLAGGGAIHAFAERSEMTNSASRGGGQLELVPNHAAYLRVAADPWAYVNVDGQKVETTPFSNPIPLRPGTHYVRLEHPQAPPELRTITLIGGESILLDVKMQVPARGPKIRPPIPLDPNLPDAAPSP